MQLLDRVEPAHLFPLIRSLLVSQLSSRREAWSVKQEARQWSPEDALDERGLGLDSFDLLTVAGRVNTMFHLHESGIEEYLLARRRPIDWAEIIIHAWQNQKRPRVTFATSGSTAAPKSVTHELASLDEEISVFLEFLPRAGRTLAYVPSHHIYGFLFTVLMPALDGSETVPAWLNPLGAPARADDRIVAFPEMWKLISAGAPLPDGVHGLSSTAPLSLAVAANLREAGLHLFEIYGSTETAGVGWRSETDAPYTLLPHWSRRTADRASTREVTVLERTVGGERIVVELPDRLEWSDEHRFRPVGRIDDTVQVGGNNVSPSRVAERIGEIPGVGACAVRLMAPHEGERLKAFVVPGKPSEETDSRAERESLRFVVESWIAENLPPHERPAHIMLGGALPRNELGKPADWALPVNAR